jgi:hypothetical protein
MAEPGAVLCAVASIVLCMVLLSKSYRASRARILLWANLCCAGLAINELTLLIAKALLAHADPSLLGASTSLVIISVLIFGVAWESM